MLFLVLGISRFSKKISVQKFRNSFFYNSKFGNFLSYVAIYKILNKFSNLSKCLKNTLFDSIRVPELEAPAMKTVVIEGFLLSEEITKVETENDQKFIINNIHIILNKELSFIKSAKLI